jgi:hypothetical protein
VIAPEDFIHQGLTANGLPALTGKPCPGKLTGSVLQGGGSLVITVWKFSPAKGPRQIHQKFIGIIEIFQKYPTLFGQ